MWLALLVALSGAVTIEELASPRLEGGWIVDQADIIDDSAEARINERLDGLHADLGIEMALVNIDATDGRTPKQFSTALFNHWGIGDAERNDGVLVLMVMGDRRLEMETGDGIRPVLTDAWLKDMQMGTMVPKFKNGQFAEGLERGLQVIDVYLRTQSEELARREAERLEKQRIERLKTQFVVPPTPPRPELERVYRYDYDYESTMMGGYGGAGLFGVLGLGMFVRRRRRTCPNCQVRMPALDEVADDEHLEPGQQHEEAIGSVNYTVHLCPTCEHVKTFRRAKWFTGYSSCPSCSYRARSSSRVTERAATTSSSGTARVTETCSNCSYHHSYTVTIPRIQESDDDDWGGGGSSYSSSSSSYSSSSSGFGGGSSSGGGAGSSW